MAFISISSGEIATGEPVSNTTQAKIQENFDNHETRILGLETSTSAVYPPIIFRINGHYPTLGVSTDVLRTTCNFNLTLTGARLLLDKAGTAGTTEVDLLYKRGAGAWTSVLTTKPSVSYTAGDNAISTNAVLDAGEVGLQAGDLIRLDITSTQTGDVTSGLILRIDYNKS